jgi:hypothetical protein
VAGAQPPAIKKIAAKDVQHVILKPLTMGELLLEEFRTFDMNGEDLI